MDKADFDAKFKKSKNLNLKRLERNVRAKIQDKIGLVLNQSEAAILNKDDVLGLRVFSRRKFN